MKEIWWTTLPTVLGRCPLHGQLRPILKYAYNYKGQPEICSLQGTVFDVSMRWFSHHRHQHSVRDVLVCGGKLRSDHSLMKFFFVSLQMVFLHLALKFVQPLTCTKPSFSRIQLQTSLKRLTWAIVLGKSSKWTMLTLCSTCWSANDLWITHISW